MPKNKKKSHKSTSRKAGLMSPINLGVATNQEIAAFLRELENRIYAQRWGMKHSILEVSESGTVLSRISFAYSTNWQEVLANLMVRPDTFALVMMSEAWASASLIQRASLANDRQEVRILQYMDLRRNNIGVKHIRQDDSYLEGMTSTGSVVNLMADALGIIEKIDDIILARTFLHSLALSFMDLEFEERSFAQEKLQATLAQPDSLEILARDFDDAAIGLWSHLGNNPKDKARAVRHLFSNLPMAPGEELEIEIRALLTPGFSLPEWVVAGRLAV